MNYYRTLIAVSDDCPATKSEVPVNRGEAKTVAVVQYEMLVKKPFGYTMEDVLFNTWLLRQNLPDQSKAEMVRLRDSFFAKPQACLRSSPLPKKFGWGFVFDEKGRVALCAIESKEYRQLLADKNVKVLKALRSSRA